MNMLRKAMETRLDPPVYGLESVGDLLAFLGCGGVVFALAWLLVWPA